MCIVDGEHFGVLIRYAQCPDFPATGPVKRMTPEESKMRIAEDERVASEPWIPGQVANDGGASPIKRGAGKRLRPGEVALQRPDHGLTKTSAVIDDRDHHRADLKKLHGLPTDPVESILRRRVQKPGPDRCFHTLTFPLQRGQKERTGRTERMPASHLRPFGRGVDITTDPYFGRERA